MGHGAWKESYLFTDERTISSLIPNAHCPMPIAQCPMPIAQCPMPNAQCPVPNAQCPMPQLLITFANLIPGIDNCL
ncbi:hypothetical protein [Tolypothrix sp. VBCCA 56010]|uniref:hypothetical protein n=1 Tax=Tolypothrix sp. VBCCA 56010 TaxID=3137731 RepID=UPI003D7C9B08